MFGYVRTVDRVGHERLIHKLKAISVSNNLLTLSQSLLDNRYILEGLT